MTNRTPQRIAVASQWRGFSNPHRVLCALLASLQLLLPSLVAALPSDGNVVGGHADIQQVNPNQLNIHQTTDKAILNWKSFSIAADEAVHFMQPSVNSIALNRVVGTDPSVILGHLQSNGRIFLLNPNGILFGAGAQIDVGGLLATTLKIRDDDFMAGRYLFAQDPLKGLKSVVNQGTIHVSDHGFVVLAAPGVSNEGLIVANLGNVVLGSGQALTVDLMGDGLINYALSGKVLDQVVGVDGKPLSSAVSNTGTIQADGGYVILQAKASGDIFSSVVNQSGVIRARSFENHGGVVQLLGGDETLVAATLAGAMRPAGNVSGAVVNTGTIDVAAGAPNAAQGSVTMVGERVGQFGSIVATGAEGANGGDMVIASTTRTLLASGSTIDVSGIGHSSGGRLRVWSDQETFFNVDATILARGGNLGGNGGFVELSGKENLGFAGTVNALAPFGAAGTLLLDPRNITIAAAGAAYNPGVNNLFGNTPAVDVTISAGSINAAAANVVLQANNDITVGSAINMANAGVGIAMQAGRDINVNASITTNNGNISLTANDAAAIAANRLAGTGDIVFGAGANLSAGTGNINLTIGSSAAAPFNPGSITTVRNLTTTTGNILLNSPNTVSLSGAVNAGSGIVSINANSDGAGAQNFTMNASSSIATTNTSANAVQVIVNSPTGGTGAASLRGSITTGNGGTATVSTRGQAVVGGNTTGGAITQGAVLTMNTGAAGTIALATGAAASNITLNTAGNNFTGAVGVSRAFNVALRDANALTLGASTISGTLGVTTAGALTQTGALNVTGVTTLAAGAANSITLNNAGNNFSTVAITNGNNVALTDANALALGASTVSGTLGVTTAGALTQSGVLTVTGVTTLTAGAANDINLATSANNFSTVGITNGNNVALRDANALVLGASTVSGTLALTMGGALSQSGALSVTGATSFTATAVNTDVLLGTQANNFGGALSFAGTLGNFRDVSIRNVNAGATVPALAGLTALRNLTLTYNNAPVALPALTLTAGGSLNVTAGGAITDSGNLIVPGTTTLAAGANNTTLDNANNFTGAVSVTSGNNVALNDINALVLGPSTVSGTLNVTTTGAVTQTGALAITGATTVAAGAANNITLNNAGNNFNTVGITSGNNVVLTDANALNLAASTVSGTFGVTTTGALTQSGALTITGVTTLAAGAANNITLGGANNFSTVAVTSGNNVTLNDTNALILGASTVSGTLGVTTAGAVTQTGALAVTGATTVAAGAANNITLTNAANNFSTVAITSGNNVSLRDANALDLGVSTVSGALALTTGGALSQSGALTVTGATSFTATAVNTDVLLGTQANNFGGALSFAGTLGNFRDVSIRNVNAGATVPALVGLTNLRNLTLTFDTAPMMLPALTASGNLTATAGGLISQSGALNVAGTASFDTIAAATLGSVTLANGGALTLNTSTVGGNLTVTTAAGDLTLPAGQTLTVVGDATLSPAGTVNLLGTTRIGGTQSSVGGTGSTFVLGADTNLNALALPAAGDITVNLTGSTASFAGAPLLPQAITLGNAGNSFGGPVSVTTAAPAFTGTTTNTYNLTQSAPVNLNVGQGLTVTDLGGTAGTRGNITLTNAGNIFNTVTFTGGNIAWVETGPVTIGGVSANAGATSTGTLSITATGLITQTGAVTTGGASTVAAGANDITLTNAANNFSTVGITSGNNVALTDANALDLGASTISGTLNVTTNGALTQSGALSVTGTTTLAAGAANNITLNNAANNFSTVGITSGNNVTLADASVLNLAASTVSGNLTATTGVTLTQSGALTVTGTTTLASTAANSDILLDTQANNFGGAVAFGGIQANIRDVSLRNTNAGATVPSLAGLTNLRNLALTFDAAPINLPTLNASGNLSATAGGSITQSGALTVGGATTLTTTVAGSDILLDTQANNFVGAVAFGGTQTNIRDIGLRNLSTGAIIPALAGVTNLRNLTLTFDNAPIALPILTISGNLIATAGGTITQIGALTIAGITTLAAGANDITLINAANNFSTVGITSGNNVSLADNTALDLGAATVTGNLNVTTGGALTQSGALNVAGTTTLAAGVNDITLNNAGNNFSAAGVTSGNNVTLTDANALTINASTASGNIAVNANDLTIGGPVASTGGNLNLTGVNTVTQSANLTAAGANTVTVTTTTGSIAMAAAATTSSGTGTITYTAGTNVTLGSLSTSGGVNVSAGGSVLSAAGSGTNVTAGANSTLEAFNGVVGTSAAPVTVNVNPGTLSIRATTAIAGISVFINGIVLPSNALTLLNVPPGLVCFNGCPVPPSNNPLGGFFGLIPSFNLDSVVPWYLHEPSDPPLISVVSTYLPKTVVAEAKADVKSDNQSVAREIPPCFPESACRPGASILAAPADGEDTKLSAAK